MLVYRRVSGDGQNTLNARKGITTQIVGFDFTPDEIISQNTLNARKGITTTHIELSRR